MIIARVPVARRNLIGVKEELIAAPVVFASKVDTEENPVIDLVFHMTI